LANSTPWAARPIKAAEHIGSPRSKPVASSARTSSRPSVAGARSSTGSAADEQYVKNKEAVGMHFALTQGLTNVDWGRTVEKGVSASAESVMPANKLTDFYAAIVASPDTSELACSS